MELSAEINITGYILEYSTYHYTYHIAKSATDKEEKYCTSIKSAS